MEDEVMTRFNPQRSIECLEHKRMMTADLGSGMLGAVSASPNTVQTSAAAAGQSDAATSHLTAQLSGSGKGSLNLTSGSANTNLMLHVSGAPAGQTFDLSIDGNVIGIVTTNTHGNGILHLNSALNNADAPLDLLPSIAADAHVSVGISGEAPILTGTLQTPAHVGIDAHGVTDAQGVAGGLSGTLGTTSDLENALITRMNSFVDHLDSHTESAVENLLATVDKVENVAGRVVGRVEGLTAATVDKLFDNPDVSGLLADLRGFVPVEAGGLI